MKTTYRVSIVISQTSIREFCQFAHWPCHRCPISPAHADRGIKQTKVNKTWCQITMVTLYRVRPQDGPQEMEIN